MALKAKVWLAFPFFLVVCNYSFYVRRTVRGVRVTCGAEVVPVLVRSEE